ncbi:MAG: UDP-N-acetylmuramoyl-L-alanine--D-glutamate ligase [Candidatus Cloacimonetes bacterium]|nr:UDP-N-acetylmuramoyl-L-alanine--D-glutamate ligase [Candidatus Cloacimonadota bacterium]MCF7814121.1 UDP-N-acetylmuramoyl-L-alanine--D-glutamate ligase [Candidatus Cloacimonadota bacterium]MCF7868730.1 UDP-N-acetylmuramoyl-L-alanine--D-glutamate ligase [Candidatus Cloacimonadota bacterium]MCF7884120.1 UDP-N-acetylmuramoyl-L-alanine--D-glutamate ligase [Candidatus Cloacimonadota bacterium]
MKVKDVKFGILGVARSGIAAAKKIKQLGGKPFLSEYKTENQIQDSAKIKAEFYCEFGGHSEKVLENDVLIVSPGIPLNIPIIQKAKAKKIEIISEIELGFRIKHLHSFIIAITGSNGKSTTVSLIHHILQTAGYKSILAGNIGTAFTSFPIEKPDIDFIVLELSSFQLELIDKFQPDVAAILNITPDHLNRYKNMEDYAKAKFNIFQNQSPGNLAILNSNDKYSANFKDQITAEIKQFSLSGKSDILLNNNKFQFQHHNISLENATLKGPHNLENMMAAVLAVSPFNIPDEFIEEAFSTFRSLPHRLEFVAEIDGIKFYNDSKATNTDAVKYALQSFEKPIRLIIGGSGKGEDYSVLNELIKKHVKKLYLIGDSKEEMAKAFADTVDFEKFQTYKDVVITAFQEAEKGDEIVLSPACTSYDMFQNFEQRGDHFKKLVRDLIK